MTLDTIIERLQEARKTLGCNVEVINVAAGSTCDDDRVVILLRNVSDLDHVSTRRRPPIRTARTEFHSAAVGGCEFTANRPLKAPDSGVLTS